MATLIIEYEPGTDGGGGSRTAVNLLLDDELADELSLTDQQTLVGELQTLELVELVRFCGRPVDLVGIEVPDDREESVARRFDAMLSAGQLQ
jgi:hypothetical protein